MKTRLRAGIIGYGYMGQVRRKTVEAHPDLELAGIADPHLAFDKAEGARVWNSYENLIDKEGPDLVFVCTPTNVTPGAVVYALEHGCHVFCEKPPGRSLADVERIRQVEAEYPDLKVVFGFNHRHHPAVADAKGLIEKGTLGRLLWLRGVYGKSGGRDYEKSWRNDPEVSGGGILLDQGVHMLDLFRYFGGEFLEVQSMIQTNYWNVPVEDNAMVLLRNGDGVMGQLHSSATLWKHTFRLEMGLERAHLVIQGLLSKTGSYGRETLVVGRRPGPRETAALGNPREEVSYYDHDPSWDLQVRHLVECIQHDKPIQDSTSLDALRVMQIIDKVYRQNAGREQGARPPVRVPTGGAA